MTYKIRECFSETLTFSETTLEQIARDSETKS